MNENKVYTVIGLMAGTSTDGIDAALMRTDGLDFVENISFLTKPYSDELRQSIKQQFGKSEIDEEVERVAQDLTRAHADVVRDLIGQLDVEQIDVIGFHGQTISHDPDHGHTLQIGDAELLAKLTGCDVVHDFRTADVKAGGQGAPLLPLYHHAIAKEHKLETPCAFLNIGGVSNVTYIGRHENDVLAFDCGPGNALIDDAMLEHFDAPYDDCGARARKGEVNQDALASLLAHPYFQKAPPKSLDRDAWGLTEIKKLSPQDQLATLTEFTVQAIIRSLDHVKNIPVKWYVCGGGRHNTFIMERLNECLDGPVVSTDVLGVDGDTLEAEGFAYLAVRSLKGLPLSLPTTTGVAAPQTGGQLKKLVGEGVI